MTNQNNAAQAAEPQTVLSFDERERILCQFMREPINHDREMAIAIESAVLSKLRAPVADERVKLPPLPEPRVIYNGEDDLDEEVYDGDQMKEYARAALASAPVADALTPTNADLDAAFSKAVGASVAMEASAPVADERAAFEKWTRYTEDALSLDAGDGYCIKGVDNQWRAWQARAALASAPVADALTPTNADLDAAFSKAVGASVAMEASAPVAGEVVYTLRVRGAIQAWTPTAAAFSIPDGEHPLFLSPAAPQASAEPVRILFPVHLRKMWSGGEVQAWLDQHQGVTPPPATTKGSLARYQQWKAEQAQASDKDQA